MLKQAMILCGGSGTRLGALTAATPKPLLEVGGRPFLDVLLHELGRHGFDDVVLLASFESEQVARYIADNAVARRFGIKLSIAIEPERSGTGGAVYHARHLANDEFLLLNGDSWFDVNLLGIGETAEFADADVVMSVREIEDAERYGVVVLDGTAVTEFLERPRLAGPGLVNAGVYRVRKPIFSSLQAKCSFERDTLPALSRAGRVRAIIRQGYFIDIGVPDSFAQAQTDVPAHQRRRAVFLDRDGVINHDLGHVGSIARFQWIDGSIDAIRALIDSGALVFVVTNQAGVARGLYTEDDVRSLHAHMQRELRSRGAHVDDLRYCPDHTEAKIERYRRDSPWRKPKPGMLLDLMAAWQIEAAGCHLIGDRSTDLEAGRAAGVRAHHFTGGNLLDFVRGAGIL